MVRKPAAGRARLVAIAAAAFAGLIALLAWPRGDAPAPGADAPAVSAAPSPPDVPFATRTAGSAACDLPHTQLPLRLVATVVRERRSLSLATVVDTQAGGHEVLSEGGILRHHPRVKLAAIERGRVLLDNDGTREQLLLERSVASGAGSAPDPEEIAYRRDLSRRLRTLTDAGTEYRELGTQRRSGLLLEGDVRPVFEGGELVGVQLDALREGGVYDQVGLRNGDIVTAVNGVPLGEPTAAARVMAELAVSDQLEVRVERNDGTEEVLSVPTAEFTEAVRALEDLEGG